MNRFPHIRWYDWCLYSFYLIHSAPDVIYILNALGNGHTESPWLPLYARYMLPVAVFSYLTALAGCLGIVMLVFQKKVGWYLALTGCFYAIFRTLFGVILCSLTFNPDTTPLRLFSLAITLALLFLLLTALLRKHVRNKFVIRWWQLIPPAFVGLCMAIVLFNLVNISMFLAMAL